jgi:hypothetical protein
MWWIGDDRGDEGVGEERVDGFGSRGEGLHECSMSRNWKITSMIPRIRRSGKVSISQKRIGI